MIVESWITPEETPALAASATAMIEDRLGRFSRAERDAYWASIRKAYNTPYNPPASKRAAKAAPAAVIEIATFDAPIDLPPIDLPPIEVQAAALASSALAAEVQAA